MSRLLVIAIALVVLLILALMALGWLIPLIWGIVRVRRKKRWGALLTTLGALWGTLAVLAVAGFTWAAVSASRSFQQKDFDADTYEGRMGKITVPYKGECRLSLLLGRAERTLNPFASFRHLRLTGQDGEFLCPTGKVVSVTTIEIREKDQREAPWVARGSLASFGGAFGEHEIRESEVLHLKVGPPFTAVAEARQEDDGTASVDLTIAGQGGDLYQILKEGEDESNNAPKFQVLGAAGEVLWEEQTEYG